MVGSTRATRGARAQGLGLGALSPLLRSQPSSEPGSEHSSHTQCTSTRANAPPSATRERHRARCPPPPMHAQLQAQSLRPRVRSG